VDRTERILRDLARSATDGVASAVVGCVSEGHRHVVTLNHPIYKPVTRQSQFELASVTKAFTGLLLAIMAKDGQVGLTESVKGVIGSDALPDNWSKISLLDLATHTSGLPNLPPNLRGSPLEPYRGWGRDHLYQAMGQLGDVVPTGRLNYSNFGVAVLAETLACRGGRPYGDLITLNVCEPLGLRSTVLSSRQEPEKRIASYTFWGSETRYADFGAMVGACGLASSIDDCLSVVERLLGSGSGHLVEALDIFVGGDEGRAFPERPALCWLTKSCAGRRVLWVAGGLLGFASFVAVDREANVGVVALLNSGRSFELVRRGFEALALLCSA
jgi:D-alanyl-D-alanine-carboxypeptidase/D-alanyl-D-alanine-endopeptidase